MDEIEYKKMINNMITTLLAKIDNIYNMVSILKDYVSYAPDNKPIGRVKFTYEDLFN